MASIEHPFDTGAVPPQPLNHETPPDVPLRVQGQIPVEARLLWPDRDEVVQAVAIRWTAERVMVSWRQPGAGPMGTAYAWLPAADVRRQR